MHLTRVVPYVFFVCTHVFAVLGWATKPVITSLSPSSGSFGTVLTITGTALDNLGAVYIGGTPCTTSTTPAPTATEIQCTLPHSTISLVNVVVKNNISEESEPMPFTYQPVSCGVGHASPTGFAPCYPCRKGSKQESLGALSCDICPQGRFASSEASSSCFECGPGTFAETPGSSRCRLCPKGTAAQDSGSAFCAPCLAGFHASDEGSAACTPCPEGTSSSHNGAAYCEKCGPGTYTSEAGRSSCNLCAKGTYTAGVAQRTCTDCPAGTYAPNSGSTSCTACPAGTASDALKSETCAVCPRGTYSTQRSPVCTPCPAGKVSEEEGSSVCLDCPPGHFQSAMGQSVCESCEPNSFSQSYGTDVCLECPDGTLAPTRQSTSCEGCPKGTYYTIHPETHAGSCAPCDPGYHQPSPNSTECLPCPVGTYTDLFGQSSCTACQPGSTTEAEGATSCTSRCEPGKYMSPTQPGRCTPCPVGTYKSGYEGRCLSCEPGSFKFTTGGDSCDTCSHGHYNVSMKATSCAPCPKGHIHNATHTGCLECVDKNGRSIGGCCISHTDCNDTNDATEDTCDPTYNRCVYTENGSQTSPLRFTAQPFTDMVSPGARPKAVARIEAGGAAGDALLEHFSLFLTTSNPTTATPSHLVLGLHHDNDNDGALDPNSTPFAEGSVAINNQATAVVEFTETPYILLAGSTQHWIVTLHRVPPPSNTPGTTHTPFTPPSKHMAWTFFALCVCLLFGLRHKPYKQAFYAAALYACFNSLSCSNTKNQHVQDTVESNDTPDSANNETIINNAQKQPISAYPTAQLRWTLSSDDIQSSAPNIDITQTGFPVFFDIVLSP